VHDLWIIADKRDGNNRTLRSRRFDYIRIMSLQFLEHSSPNFNERDTTVALQYIVLHYTGMKSGAESLTRLCHPQSNVSAHYLVEEDGRLFSLVPEEKRAWHAGKSFWRGVSDINSASFGIELVNPGHQFGYRKFPPAQIAVLKILIDDLIKRHNLSKIHALLAHSDIAPARKQDPGELFPWQDLAKQGYGLWPMPQTIDYDDADDSELQHLLRAIGYNCPTTEAYDPLTRAALLAFQRRYHPNNLTGTPEMESVARLRSVARILTAN
jgi:N-acetylmuramoyl-L-alanine amidase